MRKVGKRGNAMSSQPAIEPVIQQLQLLLTGYGYNFYNTTNQARADDLLVRERASYHLGPAIDMLARLQREYQRRFIPPLTRANPDPPAEALSHAREIDAPRHALSTIETHIRRISEPTQNRTSPRF